MKPLVLVYVDHPMCSMDCADATVDILNQNGYNAHFVGPDSYPYLSFNAENLAKAECLVMPGGMGDADQFDETLLFKKDMVREYVSNGGAYLGICQGSYFASKHYFNILEGVVAKQHIKTKNSSTKRTGPTIVPLTWLGNGPYQTYFHDGAAFVSEEETKQIPGLVLSRYENGDPAALIQKRGKGLVAVMGPHPEAPKWWYYSQSAVKYGWKYGIQHWMLLDIMKRLLKPV
jgi:glutamine amidotransferase-like uncharacterized protein